MRSPGEDGYRTPTIEDAEQALSIMGVVEESPDGGVSEAHSSALEAALQRASSRATVKPNPEQKASVCQEHNGLGLFGLKRTVSGQLSWKKRIRHITWAYFTLTMATGGLANVLYQVPFRFKGLDTIGTVVFLVNIALYLIIWALLLVRFYHYPYTFKASFMHPTESLFVPASIVSFGTILINISQYGPENTGPWLMRAVCILFWIDATLAVMFTAGIYLLLWSTQTFTIAQMTPIWIFPAYPMLIIGPHAGILSAKLEPSRSLSVIIGGMTIQGVGFLVSLMVYSAFIYRLMTQKLPKENLRPGMFVSVGPSGFTVAGLVTMAAETKRSFPADFMGNGALAADVLRIVANFSCLWLWGLAIFFFIIASAAHWSAIGHGRMVFSMTWFSFVFPNTALITATFAIGKAFSCRPIEIVGCAAILPLLLMYFFVCYMMVRAVATRQILWPQKGEDRDEGGFEIFRVKSEAAAETLGHI
ncbi:C4-dicarboxylate transporter/malic acid transport protein [Penicillium griseofulvum]|uniref:C4-dicarboxylate transporter/malic acid transport protein n=1 Tax=Penicillium patulum TaxID=5078 RepID=A0A135LXZ5_PENPA|nr:C4-dicarboxylate transporter/malic acid transport protein [Penicillium griseofulvum]KXG53828.1 C4-dicarboxylate transporter/malic acid transport protein [Penicillium griseofulvum]